jgi:DNA-directed RNA polymerase subunit M/transcription elongation factor TFIIS
METDLRKLAKKALSNVLKNTSNIDIIERSLYNNISEKFTDYSDFEREYKRNLYQVIGDILSGSKLNPIVANIKEEKIGWSHECYSHIRNRIQEQNEFIVNPFNVEEGALRCHKCNSKRVFSYAKQVRSGDESTSIFAQCVNCKAKWVV